MNQLIQSKNLTSVIVLAAALVCFGLLPNAKATDTDGALPFGNTADGVGVLTSLTTGAAWNSGFGFEALHHNTTGIWNTATGVRALFSNTTGSTNTATGVYALYQNTTGSRNTAVGRAALANNFSGGENTATGYTALYYNTNGIWNTATGDSALYYNTTGSFNTAIGSQALRSNTTGLRNTALGHVALFFNTEGNGNMATGDSALYHNTNGSFNTANGQGALPNNTTGDENTALGYFAGGSVTTANNVIVIGASVPGQNVSNSCYIGNIFGQLSPGGTGVFINSAGKLGTTTSSRRFKEDIKPMGKVSEVILALKPVIFHYKKDIDPQGAPQFGLVAEEVEKVNPDLVVRDESGEIYTVRYEAVNAMLLNEFLKEHRKVEELKNEFQATVAQQQKEIQALTAQLKEQAAQIQKVSAQLATASPFGGGLEMSRPATQTVLSNR
jgi:hypothetical protein